MITREAIEQAASQGHGIGHLTPGQTWAAHRLAIPSERLQKPLASHIATLLANIERIARGRFFGGVQSGDTEAMVAAAYDERHPMYLRRPILETLQVGLEKLFPELKPTGVDRDGNAVFNTADLAQAFGVPEETLLAEIGRRGWTDKLGTGPAQLRH